MPRPQTKETLIALSYANYEKLLTFIADLPEEKRKAEFPAEFLNRNVRDVLAHLHHWHLMLLSWYEQGMKGERPEIPAAGYTWRTVPDLNREINKKYADESLTTVKKLLDFSFKNVQRIIQKHSNDELFEKRKFKWTGTTSMGAYFVSATSSHYEWALKLIKRGLK